MNDHDDPDIYESMKRFKEAMKRKKSEGETK